MIENRNTKSMKKARTLF